MKPNVNGMSDLGSLISRVKESDASLAEQEEAFGELVRRFQDRAFACAYAILGDFGLAEDAAQAAFVSAWQKIHQLREPEAFPGWFRRLVVTECHRLMRAGRVRTVPLEEVANTATSSGGDAQHRFEQLELAKTLFNAIKRLSENERIVIMLFYVEEHSQSEIGDFLGVPVTTVAKRLYSARSRLRSTVLEGFNRRLAAHRPSRNQSFAQKVKAGIYDEYVGQYQFETRPDLIVTIRRDRDKLFSEGGGQTNRLSAKRNSPNELIATEFDGCGKFLRDSQGHISHLVYYEFGRELGRAMKIA